MTERISHEEARAASRGERGIWRGMIERCRNPKASSYHRYGGRGIRVCDRWLESFHDFLRDVGPRPSLRHSIDRIDNNGNYEPGNVRWATHAEQMRNYSRNVLVTHQGETLCIEDWAKRIGIDPMVLKARLRRHSVEKALDPRHWAKYVPPKGETIPGNKSALSLTLNDKTQSLASWAREYGMSMTTLWSRLQHMSLDEALSKPARSYRRVADGK